jgi:hypothetical protein
VQIIGNISPGQRWHQVAILFSERSRRHYVNEALEAGEVYSFVSASGKPRRWLKGDYAYLAPAAVSTFLNRCNVKHDLVREAALEKALPHVHTLFIANGGQLTEGSVRAVRDWLREPSHRLVVSGRTNLPPDLLGLATLSTVRPAGFTGWRWTEASPFADRTAWPEYHPTGARGWHCQEAISGPGAEVLAELWEFDGDMTTEASATKRRLGDGIVRTSQTVYTANEVFEFLGASLQAHINVEGIRAWHEPVHWADRIAFFLWEMLRDWHPVLAEYRLRTFGSHHGVLSIRHDVDGSADLSMLEFEARNAVPATYHILDPVISADSTTREQAETWVRATARYDFIEPGLHNDSGGEHEYIVGTGLYEHVRASERHLGIRITNCGRHNAYHVQPETLDAMDYLYERSPHTLGMCSFSFYGMIEYGLSRLEGQVAPGDISYNTDTSVTIATNGFWFPFHPVLTAVEEYRLLRGWDITHEYDSDFELIDAIYSDTYSLEPRPQPRAKPRNPPWVFTGPDDSARTAGAFDTGVYTIQFHPLYARDPTLNGGRGTLPYLTYAVSEADRREFWIANKSMLHERMRDYEDVRFRVEDGSTVVLDNPTARQIEGLMVERQRPFAAASDGRLIYTHVVGRQYLTVPPLEPGESVTLRMLDEAPPYPMVSQPNSRGFQVVNAFHDAAAGRSIVELEVIGRRGLLVSNVRPGAEYCLAVHSGSHDDEVRVTAMPESYFTVHLDGNEERWTRIRVEITDGSRRLDGLRTGSGSP